MAGLGQFSSALDHPTWVSQTYAHVCIITFFHSVDILLSWRVWKFPNAFTQALRSIKRHCLIFKKAFCSPTLPIYIIPKRAVLCLSVLLAANTRCSFENVCGIAEFQRTSQAQEALGFSFKVNLLHLHFLGLCFSVGYRTIYLWWLVISCTHIVQAFKARRLNVWKQKKKKIQTTLALQLWKERAVTEKKKLYSL